MRLMAAEADGEPALVVEGARRVEQALDDGGERGANLAPVSGAGKCVAQRHLRQQ